MVDAFISVDSVSSPPRRWTAVTPSDATDLPDLPKALYVGGGGTLALAGGDDVVASFVATTGQLLPVRAKRVRATGTSATGIVALY